jgi:hypothetical protein
MKSTIKFGRGLGLGLGTLEEFLRQGPQENLLLEHHAPAAS